MPTDPEPPVDLLLREADAGARRLVRSLSLPAQEREDLRQDLLVDALARVRGFEPGRGALPAFVGTIVRRRVSRLARRLRRERAIFAPVSLDDPLPGSEGVSLADTVTEADGYAALLGQATDPFSPIERRLDLDRALATLGPDHLRLCADLIDSTPTRMSRAGAGARASLYRQLGEIRLRLAAQGVSAA